MAEIDDPMAAASEPIIAGVVAAEAAKPAHVIAGQPLLTVQGLKKHFPIYGGVMRRQIGTVYAVDGVDFEIMPGETFSLVGESGCGKTTLGRTVIQLDAVRPTGGSCSTATSSRTSIPTTCGRCGGGCRSSSRTRSGR